MGEQTQIGAKVLRCRRELGLSQQQVAGSEMSRSFLSLVERNLCRPSLDTLEIIAMRLQKPVEYFLASTNPELPLEISFHLVQSSEEALEKGEIETAYQHAALAVKICGTIEDPALEIRAYTSLATCQQRKGDLVGAIESLEFCVESSIRARNKAATCSAYLKLGKCSFELEDFRGAERFYRRALALTQGLKSLSEEHRNSLVYLGSCLTRLGRNEEALTYYTQALQALDSKLDGWLWAMTAMSLGTVYTKLRQWEQALDYIRQSHAVMVRLAHPDRILAEHNLAILEMEAGNIPSALAMFEQCRSFYRTSGQTVKECSVSEDISNSHLRVGNVAEARAECEQALKLLDFKDNSLLRGRLYILLAYINRLEGNHTNVRPFFDIGVAIFQQLRATDNLASAFRLLGF